MSSLHVGYMVASAAAFAVLDLTRKLLAGRVDALALVFFMSFGALPLFVVLLAWQGTGEFSRGYFLPGIGALVLNLLGNVGLIYSVKLSPFSRTIPLLSLTPAFTALLGIPLLGEVPSAPQAAGIVLVVAGAMALNGGFDGAGPWRGLMREKGALIMIGVAAMWSLSGPLDKLALDHASVLVHATVMTTGVAFGALALLALGGRLAALESAHGEARLLLVSMVAVGAALSFQLLAIQGVFVSLVEAFKRSTGSLLALVLGRVWFDEPVQPTQVAAVGVMATGVWILLR